MKINFEKIDEKLNEKYFFWNHCNSEKSVQLEYHMAPHTQQLFLPGAIKVSGNMDHGDSRPKLISKNAH